MGKQLDKDMMRMRTMTERFNYIAAKKRMEMSISKSQTTNQDDWVDRDESDWDSSSDGSDRRGDNSYDDSNEY